LQEKVKKDNRLELSKKELIQKKLSVIKYRPVTTKVDDLYSFTDSAMIKSSRVSVNGIDANTTLFSFAKQNIKAEDWLKFVKNSGNISYPVDRVRYRELYKEYLNASADQYYRSNLDAYNSDFVKQVKEFKEANLLFGIMEKNVWGKANSDTAALGQYYNSHKSKYIWPPSADAIIVTCNNENQAQELSRKLKDNPGEWRQITTGNDANISADSGRYELSQLPVRERTNFTPGLITAVVKNEGPATYTFNYLIKVYSQPEQRSFDDARGMVISDYQAVLEDEWLKELKKKYPVTVNQAVFQSIK
jgi:peptidyl-prolyl cis-trans isomerase SurA